MHSKCANFSVRAAGVTPVKVTTAPARWARESLSHLGFESISTVLRRFDDAALLRVGLS
jgi:hypothetical protein